MFVGMHPEIVAIMDGEIATVDLDDFLFDCGDNSSVFGGSDDLTVFRVIDLQLGFGVRWEDNGFPAEFVQSVGELTEKTRIGRNTGFGLVRRLNERSENDLAAFELRMTIVLQFDFDPARTHDQIIGFRVEDLPTRDCDQACRIAAMHMAHVLFGCLHNFVESFHLNSLLLDEKLAPGEF